MKENRQEIIPRGTENLGKSGRPARKLLLKPVHSGRGLPLGFLAVGLIAGLSLIPVGVCGTNGYVPPAKKRLLPEPQRQV